MISIKDYAEQKGVTTQAVYKQLQTHSVELKGCIVKQGRTRYLTDEAVAILNQYRESSPQVIERTNDRELIEQLRMENKNLLIKIAAQADKIADLSDWKSEQALLIAEAGQKQLLLEERTKQLEELEQTIKEVNAKLQQAEQRADQLQREVERPLSLIERLTGKRK